MPEKKPSIHGNSISIILGLCGHDAEKFQSFMTLLANLMIQLELKAISPESFQNQFSETSATILGIKPHQPQAKLLNQLVAI